METLCAQAFESGPIRAELTFWDRGLKETGTLTEWRMNRGGAVSDDMRKLSFLDIEAYKLKVTLKQDV